MSISQLKLIALALGISPLMGCAIGQHINNINDTIEFRTQLHEQQMAIRQAELERERTELERLRRAEINEIRRETSAMVPELKSTLETKLAQKITNLRLVPDYAQMAKTAAMFAKLEEQNERIYQEQLAKWLEEQAEVQRSDAQFASWHPSCRIHGHGCNCPPEADCGKPAPKRAPVRAPVKSSPPKMPVRYKMEFEMDQDVESQAYTEAQPGRAPVKERCLPEKGKACGKDDCEHCGHGFRRGYRERHNYQAGSDYQEQTGAPPAQPPIPVIYDETALRSGLPTVQAVSGQRLR
ncbi:MAG: hypothetical protein H8E66_23500 [Planctomycetes bacterium]|nr:hypothetical protein [Planctomycetota bacterium]